MPNEPAGLLTEELSVRACREKLENSSVGRLGVSVDALPVVLPVKFAVDGNRIVIRTMPGAKLSSAINQAVVAFEVDGYDAETDRGWSVLVQGTAREITSSSRLEHARSLSLRPAGARSDGDRFVELEMEIVTGRHIEPVHDR